ncbi:hypothetical protein KTD15_11205 [Burkholderia multivorans]|nr:hypothetical protein [Burkholderia multivorans]
MITIAEIRIQLGRILRARGLAFGFAFGTCRLARFLLGSLGVLRGRCARIRLRKHGRRRAEQERSRSRGQHQFFRLDSHR